MSDFHADFDRGDAEDLGPNWVQTYTAGEGQLAIEGAQAQWCANDQPLVMHSFSVTLTDPVVPPDRLIVYTQFGPQELARTCSICTQEWQAGDEVISHNGGPFMHKACEERMRAAQP